MVNLSMYTRIGVAVLLCAIAAWTDFRTFRIPNRLTLTGLALGLALGLAASGLRGLLAAAAGALVTALVPLLLFKMRAMGGGDVKLFAAIGALLGAGVGLETQMAAFMLGGVQGIIIWFKRGQLKQGFANMLNFVIPPVFRRRKNDAQSVAWKTEMRFGPAVFLGLIAACSVRFLG
jgi:prepilin peptidase CpaA